MNLKDAPDLKSAIYTEALPLKVEPELKEQYMKLKSLGKDHSEIARQLLREGFRRLLEQAQSAS